MERRYAVIFVALVLVSVVLAHSASHGAKQSSKKLKSDILNAEIVKHGHTCDHDARAAKLAPAKPVDQSFARELTTERFGKKRGSKAMMPYRISVAFDNIYGDSSTCYNNGATVNIDGSPYTCTENDILTPEKLSYLNDSMIQAAVHRFHELLQVDRNLVAIGTNGGSGCDAAVPARFIGNIDTDFLLLVTVRPIPSADPSSRTLAYATTCQNAGVVGDFRPIVGWANFDPSVLDPGDDNKLALQVGVAAHEISHAMGFNYGAFNSRNMLTGDRVTSQKIVDYVRAHFGCNTAPGALLEDGGGGGTQGSHWEKAAFMNEYMTGTAANNPVITPLTLLAFEATGWYEADLSKSDSLVFGRGGGCGMIEDWTGCSNWPSSYRCDAVTGTFSKCTADRAGYGPCVQEPSTGSLIGADCTYHGSQTTCIFPFPPGSPQAAARAGNGDFQTSGQSFAADSRCFDSTLNKIASLTDIIPVPAPSSPKCYRVHCSADNEPRLSIKDIWYPCSTTGTKITATNFGGSVDCPADSHLELCQNRPYDPDWPRLQGIDPAKAKPSQTVTITYTGAQNDTGMSAIIEFDCEEETVTEPGKMTAKIAESDEWGSPKYLNLFRTQVNVILKDSQGRSDVQYKAFQADIGFGLAYLKALFNWMKKNVLFTVLICIAIAIPCLIACFCCYKKCCKKKKKKPLRTQYQHNYDRESDAYYYDEEMDDRARHAPPRAINS
jgi:hypothetical protein